MNLQIELEHAVYAARQAAILLHESFAVNAGIESLNAHDIKTRADLAAEACILENLAKSGIPVLAEESAVNTKFRHDQLHWLVDPLDGTMNFTRGFPICAVSIGLWDGKKPLLGVVFDLNQQKLYTGIVGKGAWCDRKPIHVSTITDQSQAILATGFPAFMDYGQDSLNFFVQRVQSFKKIRMIGSAAMSLAMVATGTFDAYHEEEIMVWDVAAGMALVVAAGGQIQIANGSKTYSVIASATNGRLQV